MAPTAMLTADNKQQTTNNKQSGQTTITYDYKIEYVTPTQEGYTCDSPSYSK